MRDRQKLSLNLTEYLGMISVAFSPERTHILLGPNSSLDLNFSLDVYLILTDC